MKLDEAKLLQLAATTEADSAHPLARSIVEEAKTRQLPLLKYTQFNSIAGGVIQARVERPFENGGWHQTDANFQNSHILDKNYAL